MRFQVPQNLDIPDTIFLGLSFIQLLYLGGGIGFFVFLLTFVGGIIAIIIGVPVIIFALLLAFFKYNHQSFPAVLQFMVRFFMSEKMYIWKQEKSETAPQIQSVRRGHTSDTMDSAGESGGKKIKMSAENLLFREGQKSDVDEPEVYI